MTQFRLHCTGLTFTTILESKHESETNPKCKHHFIHSKSIAKLSLNHA